MDTTSEVATLDEVLRLLTVEARGGSVTAQKALLDHLRRDQADEAPKDDWESLYGDGNVTPIRRPA